LLGVAHLVRGAAIKRAAHGCSWIRWGPVYRRNVESRDEVAGIRPRRGEEAGVVLP